MSKERRSGFELLRVLCIVGIIVMHTFPGVGEHASVFNREMNVLANSVFNTAVTCFVLISGYFGIQFRMKKLIELDLMVICFSVLSTVVMGNYGMKALVKACMPVITRQYWFISCYFALCILAPCLNLIVEKGSVCIDGISLTVAKVDDEGFQVSVIPHTGEETILLKKATGDLVNLENDIIGKYVEKLMGIGKKEESKLEHEKKTGITMEFLEEFGF